MEDYINPINIMKLFINVNKLPIETIKIICETFEISYNENITILNKNIINKFKPMDIKRFNDINTFIQNEINNLNLEKDTNNIKNDINGKFNKLDINTEVSKTINIKKRNF